MQFEVFFNFDGNCREAVEFYAKVFRSEVKNLMTYREMPPDPNYTVAECDLEKVLYADVQIGNMTVMVMDFLTGMPFVKGNQISPTISADNKEEVQRLFTELQEGGTVDQELQQTFFSELYGMVTDKFGIIWQILYHEREENI